MCAVLGALGVAAFIVIHLVALPHALPPASATTGTTTTSIDLLALFCAVAVLTSWHELD